MDTPGYMDIVHTGVLGAYKLFLEFALFTDATAFICGDKNCEFSLHVSSTI